MSFKAAKCFLEKTPYADRIIVLQQSSATVEEAAQALGCQCAHIAKTLSFYVDEKPILIVAAGDAKVDNQKFKATFHTKARMIPGNEVEAAVGHAPGGVCPFGAKEGTRLFLDISLKRFDTIYPAAGNANSAVRLSTQELDEIVQPERWIDVCKGWNEGFTTSTAQ